jgi:hypothetical protein
MLPPSPCLERFETGRGGSVLYEQRAAGKPMRDFAERYPAAKIDPATYLPMKITQAFQSEGRPILWLNPDRSAPVVDERVFSDLAALDVSRLRAGERHELGQLRAKLEGREVLRFLITSDTIRTYIHIGAWVCLEADGVTGGAYEAALHGEHEYFTNERNVQPFSFVFTLAEDGTMAVTGRQR